MIKFAIDGPIRSDTNRVQQDNNHPIFKAMNIHPRYCASSMQMMTLRYMPLFSHVKIETVNLTHPHTAMEERVA